MLAVVLELTTITQKYRCVGITTHARWLKREIESRMHVGFSTGDPEQLAVWKRSIERLLKRRSQSSDRTNSPATKVIE